jgi:hypothetical protein
VQFCCSWARALLLLRNSAFKHEFRLAFGMQQKTQRGVDAFGEL